MHFLLSGLASLSLMSLARSAELTSRALSGEATFYGGNLHGGACSYSTYTLPAGVFGTALSDSNWDNSGNCGACISVTGPDGNSITAMVRLTISLLPSTQKIDLSLRSWMNVLDVGPIT
jgi:expansin